ncbi:sulfotransferase family protein [Gloeocapsopsis dulcis]|uniref:Sulfotransferase n=1 Tax=Gloeocapsopsis dulcis AAB1 = 1H9 TaxID=1433147 RepID=A0A6N8FRS9_9CHRO|nr:sulfotransferase [Gloeocapsopsis dulcis]MUL35803.1 hypothetical protein [Gloeocapsopsis dulcis AAB1 = 1H9]WNN87730.1 sulfotransferase [Gloeocapsopsis dulcis]
MKSKINLIDCPFFIVFEPRSGSTLLANLLVKSADIALPPESNFIKVILSNYPKNLVEDEQDLQIITSILYKDIKFEDWNINVEEITRFVQPSLPISVKDFILTICTIYKNKNFPTAKIFGLKHTYYLIESEKIKLMFPSSKFIGLVRDGRAVFNSKKNSIYSVTGQPFETNPYRAAKQWCKTLNLLKKLSTKYPKDTFTLYYEELINSPDETVRLLCIFLGVAYRGNNLDRKYTVPRRYGNLHKNIYKEAMPDRIEVWRSSLSANEIYAFESIAYKYLILAGYELINNYFILKMKRIKEILQLPFKYLLSS